MIMIVIHMHAQIKADKIDDVEPGDTGCMQSIIIFNTQSVYTLL